MFPGPQVTPPARPPVRPDPPPLIPPEKRLEVTVKEQVATLTIGSESVTLDREGILDAQRQLQRAAGDF